MRKAGLTIICVGIALLGLSVNPATSEAGADVSIGLHEAFVLPAHGPGYGLSDISLSLVFHQGHWYRPFRGNWYRSRWRTGPWGYIAPHRVPRAIVILPPAMHHSPPVHHGFPHGRHERHWKRW
jgi:hypothetical protein